MKVRDSRYYTLVRAGEGALLVRFAGDGPAAGRASLYRRLSRIPGVREVVPGLRSVAVLWDPGADPSAGVVPEVRRVLDSPGEEEGDAGRLHVIPVRYGGGAGPDLLPLAERTGLRPAEVVALHAGSEYRVTAIGFLPGFPYLEPLPAVLRVPRRATPRLRVPTGSVAVAQGFCGIYPSDSPGGWWILGRTDLPLFDPAADPPARLQPGDRVRFVPAGGEP